MNQIETDLTVGRERLTRVFRYLEALHQHRNPVKRQIDGYQWVLWLRDLPEHSSVIKGNLLSGSGWETEPVISDDYLLKVGRPKLTQAPEPPPSITEWLEPGWDNPETEAKLKTVIDRVADGETVLEYLESDSERFEALRIWHARRNEWAGLEKPARAAMRLFERLYDLYGWIQKEAERIEIVLGDGILNWRREDGPIHHPILLTRLQLEFNPNVPEFIITEADAEVQLYSALFRSMADIDGRLIAKFREELEPGLHHPLGATATSDFLKGFVNQLSPRGEFRETDLPDQGGDGPSISRSPVLFVRDRSQGFGVAIEGILEDLKERPDLPKHLLNIVGVDPPGDEGEYEPDPEDTWSEPEDILLGKPANPEQIAIARNIEKHHGVLVQGPPGTGKTHSIANLIGHFLARGKSVLVTSHTTKALRVLRDQVVDELRPLCVSVLESDSFSRQQLEESIEGIVNRLNTSNPDALNGLAHSLSAERKALINRLKTARQSLLAARNEEYRELVVAGQKFSPADAARKVAQGSGTDDWIPKPVAPDTPLPLTESELLELYQTNINLSAEEEEELAHPLPDLSDLLSPADFTRFVAEMEALAGEDLDYRWDLWDELQPGPTPAALETLASQMAAAVAFLSEEEPWKLAAVTAGYKGGLYRGPWDSLLKIIAETVEFAVGCQENLLRFAPSITDDQPLEKQQATVARLIEYLARKTKLGVVQRLAHPDWAKFIENSKVKGKEPQTLEHFTALADLINLKMLRQTMTDRWELQLTSLGAPAAAALGPEPEAAAERFGKILAHCLDWYANVWSPLEQALTAYGFHWESFLEESPPKLSPYGELLSLKETVTGALPKVLTLRANHLHYQEFKSQFEQLEKNLLRLGPDCPKVVSRLKEAVQTRNSQAYQGAFAELAALDGKRDLLERRCQLLKGLEAAAPGWAKKIRMRAGIHGLGTLPGDAGDAWLWRQLDQELDARGRVSLAELQQKIESLSSELRTVTSRLIEAKAWAAQLERVKIPERQSLVGYLEIMRKIGAGKGKRAHRLRAEARRKMVECRKAVPVWIMPLSRVVENFNPQETRFDLVIIDEASQSDVMGLIAFYLAEKVVIVGDHEQVSPLAIGQKLDVVEQMIAEHLRGIPNNLLYDGQMSVYDLARTSFGGTICLLEHFRCAPEIIQFSNGLSYRGRIKPLRDTSRVRIKPAVIPYHVPAGYADDKINREEAKTIAALIMAMVETPEYRDKTIGVVSLLGNEQAFEIDKILRNNLSEAEYAKRQIVCGNASHFQGDERDIMFLSMVYGPSADPPLKMLDSGYQGMYQKRFNVAASRAKDQMWVVYSLDPKVDLKPGDLRRRLIEHAFDPQGSAEPAIQSGARPQSAFEREVSNRLQEAGYRVVPLWKVGYYTLDLVVEGNGKRLAVECDGDRSQPPEKAAEDLARQALLERLGWTFIRVRASQFLRDPDRAIRPVLKTLAELEICPEGNNGEVISEENSELIERIISQGTLIYNRLGNTNQIPRVKPELIEAQADTGTEVLKPVKYDNVIKFTKKELPPKKTGANRSSGLKTAPAGHLRSTLLPGDDPSIPEESKPETSNVDYAELNKEVLDRIFERLTTEDLIDGIEGSSIEKTRPVSSSDANLKLLRLKSAENLQETGFDLIDFLSEHGLEILDLRSDGGTIWIVGGLELASIIALLKPQGFNFKYLEDGSPATDHRPAWHLVL
jgi:very-short-patch-repair endonuclease